MSFFYPKIKKCAVCGAEQEIMEWASIHTQGGSNLDFRLNGVDADTINLCAEECPKCGFVSTDIENVDDAETYKKIVNSYRFQKCDGIKFKNSYVEKFYRIYLLDEENCNNEDKLFYSLRKVAWACDDVKDEKNAIKCRMKALKYLENLLSHKSKNQEYFVLIKMDMLRRCKKFNEVINCYNDFQFINSDNKAIWQYQKLLAKNKDSDIHSFDEILFGYEDNF